MPDEIFKTIQKQLEDHEKRIHELEKSLIGEGEEGKYPTGKSTRKTQNLAGKIGVTEDDIEKIFDIEADSLTLVQAVGKDDKEKTKNLTLLALLGYRYFFSVGEVLSSELKRNTVENRIPVNNFATYLNEITPSLIRRKGKFGSKKTVYRLTALGEVEARELLKNLTKNQ